MLLMRICPNTSMAHEVLMMHLMRLLTFHPYIYGGESPRAAFSIIPQSLSVVISSLFCFCRPTKVKKPRRKATISL